MRCPLSGAKRTWMPVVSSFQSFQSFRRNGEFNRFGPLLMKDPGKATTRPSSPGAFDQTRGITLPPADLSRQSRAATATKRGHGASGPAERRR
jgi:hypothetical protein